MMLNRLDCGDMDRESFLDGAGRISRFPTQNASRFGVCSYELLQLEVLL
jgi:hypothetical protein